ncbi:MAG TPA: plasmid pRiA4b ORF-3 family protein [Nitrospiria bacterium]
MNKPKARIYRFKVSLLGIEPEIWRLIEVSETYTFWDLHVAIQDAMGWLDYHLHEFVPESLRASNTGRIGIPESSMDDEYIAGWTVPITEYFASAGDLARYDYDFGDGWSHEVRLMAIEPKERGTKYPRCIDGKRACPPEDCGGISGYYQLLEILADPQDDEHDEMVEWLRGHAKNYFPYHPDMFEASAVKFWNPKKRWKMMMGHET